MEKNTEKIIKQHLFSVQDAHQYFGGNIGVNRIRQLFLTLEIPSWREGNRLVTLEKHLYNYLQKKNIEAEMLAEKVNNFARKIKRF